MCVNILFRISRKKSFKRHVLNYSPQCQGVKVAICFLVCLLQISLSPWDPTEKIKAKQRKLMMIE